MINRYITPKTVKGLLILLVVIYAITAVERALKPQPQASGGYTDFLQDKNNMQKKLDEQTQKSHNYEIKILQNSVDIVNMSSSERDSLRAVLNPR